MTFHENLLRTTEKEEEPVFYNNIIDTNNTELEPSLDE